MRSLMLILFSFLLINCIKLKEKPEDLIGKKEMVDLLVDFYLYQNFNTIQISNNSSNEIPKINLAVAKKHNVEINQFQKSMDYYILEERDTYKDILKDVAGKLSNLAPTLVEDTLSLDNKLAKERPNSKNNLQVQKAEKLKAPKKFKDSVNITLDRGEFKQLELKKEELKVGESQLKVEKTSIKKLESPKSDFKKIDIQKSGQIKLKKLEPENIDSIKKP